MKKGTASCSPPGLSLLLGPSLCGQQGTDITYLLSLGYFHIGSHLFNRM